MNVHDQISDLIIQLRSVSLPHFLPELIVCATIVLNLLVRIVKLERWIDAFCITLVGGLAFIPVFRSGTLAGTVDRRQLNLLLHEERQGDLDVAPELHDRQVHRYG